MTLLYIYLYFVWQMPLPSMTCRSALNSLSKHIIMHMISLPYAHIYSTVYTRSCHEDASPVTQLLSFISDDDFPSRKGCLPSVLRLVHKHKCRREGKSMKDMISPREFRRRTGEVPALSLVGHRWRVCMGTM